MRSKLEQLNQSYRKALGRVIAKLFPNETIIIADVLVDPNYRSARVWVKADRTQLSGLQTKRREIQASLREFIRGRYTITLKFLPDDNLVETMDKLFEAISNEN